MRFSLVSSLYTRYAITCSAVLLIENFGHGYVFVCLGVSVGTVHWRSELLKDFEKDNSRPYWTESEAVV